MNVRFKFFEVLSLLFVVAGNEHHISKRYLLFQEHSILQFNYGISSPLILPKRSINLSWVLQVNYNYPYNLTNFMPMTISAREGAFDLNRKLFYEHIIAILDSIGLDGENCLLRSICEVSETPMHMAGRFNLLETIVHYILTPSLDLDRESPIISQNVTLGFNDKLLLAEDFGRLNGNCGKMYYGCNIPLVDLFTSKYIMT